MKRKILSVLMVLLLVMNLGMVVSAEGDVVTVSRTGTVDGYSFRGTSVIDNSGAYAKTECSIGCVMNRVICTYEKGYESGIGGQTTFVQDVSAHNCAFVSFTAGTDCYSFEINSVHLATNEQTGHVSSFTTGHLYY